MTDTEHAIHIGREAITIYGEPIPGLVALEPVEINHPPQSAEGETT